MDDISAVAVPTVQVVYHDELDSTNNEAKRLVQAGDACLSNAEVTVIVAGAQTSGRGRLGRSWVSPSGAGLYCSVIHACDAKQVLTPYYTLAAGLAVMDTLADVADAWFPKVALKPINDVMAVHEGETKKLAGILVEGLMNQAILHHVITGVGINLTPANREFDREADKRDVIPVSLQELTNTPPTMDIKTMAEQLAQAIHKRYHQLNLHGEGFIELAFETNQQEDTEALEDILARGEY